MTVPKLTALAVCVALGASIGIWFWSGVRNAEPSPRSGILDLGGWNFARDGSVSLAGQWLYFDRSWEQRSHLGAASAVGARVPGPWPAREANSGEVRQQGFGTYTLKIHLPAATAGDTFVVNSGQILAAYRLFANGRLIAAPGIPSETAQGERDNSYSVLADLPPSTRNVELSLELSNHVRRYGGIFVAPSIGLKSALEAANAASQN